MGGTDGGAGDAPRHVGRRIGGAVLLVGVLAALALAGLVTVAPAAVGGSTFTVLSPSMEPALPVGSVVVTRPQPPGAIGVGDVITFVERDPGARGRLVTHRVVGVEPGPAFRTRGDANAGPDRLPVAASDVRGVLWYSVPWLGTVAAGARTLPGLALVGGVLLLLTVLHRSLPRHATRRSGGRTPGA